MTCFHYLGSPRDYLDKKAPSCSTVLLLCLPCIANASLRWVTWHWGPVGFDEQAKPHKSYKKSYPKMSYTSSSDLATSHPFCSCRDLAITFEDNQHSSIRCLYLSGSLSPITPLTSRWTCQIGQWSRTTMNLSYLRSSPTWTPFLRK